MELFRLMGRIAIDNSEANRSIVNTQDEAKRAGEDLGEFSSEGEKTEGRLGKAFQKIGKAAAVVGKAVAVGLVAAGAAVIKIGKDAIASYADYEQLVGGVETLFKDSADTVIENAGNAYKTAGMSANEYMETVTGFSASLLQSLGNDTVAAAEKADMAIIDMSDNANKMGTDIGSIQYAYQGFAKQNYTMLDNLKLGYGGTKEEMQRLLEDAEKISGFKYDVSSYSDIVDAIHVVQTEMGITGTTAKEASTTIQGSLSSMKGAWQNLLTGLTDESQDFDALVNNLFDSMVAVGDNLIPRISVVLDGVAKLVTTLAPKIIEKIPGIISTLLPALIEGAVALVEALVSALPAIIDTLIDALPALIDGIEKIFIALVDALPVIIQALVDALPTLIPQLVNGLIAMILALMDALPEIILPIVEALPEIIISIVDAMMENLPALIEGCVQLIIALVRALPQIMLALIEALPTIYSSVIEGLIEALPMLIEGIVQILVEIANAIIEYYDGLGAQLLEFFGTLWEGIKNAFAAVVNFFKDLFRKAWEGIKSIWNAVVGFFTGIWNGVKDAFASVKNFFSNTFSDAWKGIKNTWNSVTGFFKGIWSGVKNAFSGVSTFFKDIFQSAYDGVTGIFSKIGAFFSNAFSNLGSAVKGPVNSVIRGLNGLIGGLNKIHFDIPDWVPVIGGKSFGFNIGRIPMLAKGGIVDKPTPAVIGEDGEEAVVPLERNTGWIRKIAEQIYTLNVNAATKAESVTAGAIRDSLKQPDTGAAERSEILATLKSMLAIIKELNKNLYEVIVDALCNGTEIVWDERNIARLVRKYA